MVVLWYIFKNCKPTLTNYYYISITNTLVLQINQKHFRTLSRSDVMFVLCQIECFLFCLLQNECSDYYRQTSRCSIILTSLSWQTKQESYGNKSQFATFFICWQRNRKGHKIDRCGHLLSVLAVLEYLFFIFIRKHLSERYDWNHIIEWFENPRDAIFLRRMSWFVDSVFVFANHWESFQSEEQNQNLSAFYLLGMKVNYLLNGYCKNQIDISGERYNPLDIP